MASGFMAKAAPRTVVSTQAHVRCARTALLGLLFSFV